jgi:hypothetical protein
MKSFEHLLVARSPHGHANELYLDGYYMSLLKPLNKEEQDELIGVVSEKVPLCFQGDMSFGANAMMPVSINGEDHPDTVKVMYLLTQLMTADGSHLFTTENDIGGVTRIRCVAKLEDVVVVAMPEEHESIKPIDDVSGDDVSGDDVSGDDASKNASDEVINNDEKTQTIISNTGDVHTRVGDGPWVAASDNFDSSLTVPKSLLGSDEEFQKEFESQRESDLMISKDSESETATAPPKKVAASAPPKKLAAPPKKTVPPAKK